VENSNVKQPQTTMRTKTILTIFFLLLSQLIFSQTSLKRKTNWTVAETRAWADSNKNIPTWNGWLLYQGSDAAVHHFISRVMDEWVWFKIKRTELVVLDERKYKTTSSGPLGYYYVDATKDFVKIKDY
jgi:hypothetical protein